MKLHVIGSGGMANIQVEGILEATDMPSDLWNSVQACLIDNQQFSSPASPEPFMCDSQQLSIDVIGGGRQQHLEFNESSTDPAVWNLCNELVHQLILKKSKKST